MKKKVICISSVIFLLFVSVWLINYFDEQTINIIEGQEVCVKLDSPCKLVSLSQDSVNIGVNGQFDTSYEVDTEKNLIFLSQKAGFYDLKVNIYNGIPLKRIKVNVIPNSKLYVGGDLIGVKLNTSGVIVVGFGSIMQNGETYSSPANAAGIRKGDIVKQINNVQINKASEVREVLTSLDKSDVTIKVLRDDKTMQFTLTPIFSDKDKGYKIGLWVRDNVAGIGTLSFVTEDKTMFAALGHAITDTSTDITVPVKNGELLSANAVNIIKSEKDKPGEICGVFSDTDNVLGYVTHNDEYGLYGKCSESISVDENMLYPIALQEEIVEGPALMICMIDDEKKEYEVNVKKVNYQTKKDSKSMLIEITDEALLAKTGGIVQGMSGSPIIQNGKVIGALTHVLVSEPNYGYAIFIEWMAENIY